MPTVVGNMVKETTTTTGTGTIDLDGAPTGFQGFADEFTSGAAVPYTLVDDPDNPNAWEVGLGTFTAGTPNTLSRDTVYASSASGSKITLSGTTTVISTPLAAQTTVKDGDNTLTGANTFNGPLVAGPGTELTISSGSITPTGNYHTVDTESDAATDNLDSIVVTNVPDGGYLLLKGEAPTLSPPRVVTVRHGISPGNITLIGGVNFVMDTAEAALLLQRRGSLFVEVVRTSIALITAPDGSELTISAGAITPTASYHTVDTESDAAADNLDTIQTTNIPDGGILILRGEAPTVSPARIVTIRSGVSPGNITLSTNAPYALDAAEKSIVLQRRGALFVEIARSAQAGLVSVQSFTSSDTWNRPAGITRIVAEGVGGGGGGGGGGTDTPGGGGGGGGYCKELIDVSAISSVTVTIGGGGAGDTGTGTGSNGGNTTFGAHWTAGGGAGGVGGASGSAGGAGGTASGGDVNIAGQPGGYGGGQSVITTNTAGGQGGNSMLGFGHPAGNTNTTASLNDGGDYGGGGGGGVGTTSGGGDGGTGGEGVIIVWEYA